LSTPLAVVLPGTQEKLLVHKEVCYNDISWGGEEEEAGRAGVLESGRLRFKISLDPFLL
jgi:hypothetical protein